MPSNDNYILAFDEQGKPYIAHSMLSNMRSRLFQSRMANGRAQQRSPRQNHKYILRIDDNGRKRYFYTQEEIQAYYKTKRGGTTPGVEKNQNGTSMQDAAKNAVSLAKTQTARMYKDYQKLAEDNKATAASSSNASSSTSSKPYTGVADYARQKAADANTPKSTYTPPAEDESETKKSSKKSSSSNDSGSSSSGRSSSGSGSSRAAAQQAAPVMQQMPTDMFQQIMNAQKIADTDDEEFDDTIAKAAKQLEGADKYDEYKKAVEEYKTNPSKENAEKRDKLKQEWLETPHGKFVSSVSAELKSKKQAKEQKQALNGIYSGALANSNSSPSSALIKLNRR